MDRRAFIAAALGAVAGCGSGGSGGGVRTVAPDLQGTPPPSPTSTAEGATAPWSGGDGTRSAVLSNLTHHETAVDLLAREGNRTVFETSARLEPAETVRAGSGFEPGTTLVTSVTTADGPSRAFEWTLTEERGNLWVGLGRDISFRDGYDPGAATTFVTGHTGVVRDAPDEEWAPLLVDNPGEVVDVRIALSTAGGGLGGLSLQAPARSRLWLPLTVPDRRVDVGVVRGDAEATTTWRPLVDGPLNLRLDGPRFTCDPLYRDLRIENGADRDRSARVAVETDGQTAVVETATLDPGAGRTWRAAIPPAGRYVVRVDTDGERSAVALPRCPPVGPLVVTLRSDGVRVAARQANGGLATTVTATAVETDDGESTGTSTAG